MSVTKDLLLAAVMIALMSFSLIYAYRNGEVAGRSWMTRTGHPIWFWSITVLNVLLLVGAVYLGIYTLAGGMGR